MALNGRALPQMASSDRTKATNGKKEKTQRAAAAAAMGVEGVRRWHVACGGDALIE